MHGLSRLIHQYSDTKVLDACAVRFKSPLKIEVASDLRVPTTQNLGWRLEVGNHLIRPANWIVLPDRNEKPVPRSG